MNLTLLDGVTWDGLPVPGERGHQLLAALTLAAPRAVGVGDLVERLWPEEEPAHPEKALQVLVSRTRARTSADAVLHGAGGYRLGLREDQVDALEVRRLVRQAREARGAGDLDVARYAAHDALGVPLSAAAAGPLADLAEAVRADQDTARRLLGSVLLARGDAAAALPLLEAVLAQHPGDEEVMADLLRAEADVRGVPAALEHYAGFVERSLDVSGAEPGERLRRLHAELLAREAPVREGLQYEASPLIGRDDAVADVRTMLASARVVSMVGPGGLGKTRMAHLVGRLAQQPVVYFVELAGVNAPEGVARKVAADLGVRDSLAVRTGQRSTDLRGRIAEKLAGAPTLLVLDNCEHLVDAVADLVAFLVVATDGLRVLTTSRAPLGIAAEQVYPLAQLHEEEAVELFGQRARAARPGVRLEPDEVRALVARLDGLPLAIELAAAKVRVMAVEEITRRLEDRFGLLTGGDRTAPGRHQTLEAVIDWSWNLLRAEDQQALRWLTVFPDGFSLAGAEALLGHDPLPSLAELIDQSLVVVTETGSLRYRFLETVREYGLKQLDAVGEHDEAMATLRTWALAHGRALGARLFTRDQVAAMTDTRAEVGNLAAVMRTALDARDRPTVVVLAGLLAGFWSIEGDHITVLNLASPVLDVVLDHDGPGYGEGAGEVDLDELLGTISMMLINEGIFSGHPRPDGLAELGRLPAGSGGRASVTRSMLLAMFHEDGPRSVEDLEQLAEAGDRLLARTALQWLSQRWENEGELDQARRALESSLALCDGDDGPWTAALCESMLAGLASQEGDAETCLRHARRALPVMEQLGATQDTLELRAIMALCELKLGRVDSARRTLEAIAADPLSNAAGGWSAGLLSLAELAFADGDVDGGLDLVGQSVETAYGMRAIELPVEHDLTPWVLFSETVSVFTHVVHNRAEKVAPLVAKLRSELPRIFDGAGHRGEVDVPVVGCILLALGGYDLATGDDPERSIDALALARRFGYQRTLPSMDWDRVQRLAEQYAPGLLEPAVARYADRPATQLRDEAAASVAASVAKG
ncbi:transcriptional regulator [Nocardioides mangrovicus]|uniref:Transcriptional regulator n=1 Tax=Nocardioides mangrovicus TaxID=2478913 RepID=A0A3L8P4G3_9ACTN|nr:BTAD domain-containing putative transcriptional regulator [Nocardioides mangrovicus]RLV50306.1 transcriptional regulator [Nocardioides mangrovicus]